MTKAIGMFTMSSSCVLQRCKQQVERPLELRQRDAILGCARFAQPDTIRTSAPAHASVSSAAGFMSTRMAGVAMRRNSTKVP